MEAVNMPGGHPESVEQLQDKLTQLNLELNGLHKAIQIINHLAGELDIQTAMDNVRTVALELLDCEKVTLFLIFERRQELRGQPHGAAADFIIRVKFGEGIAGSVAQTGELMNIPDTYAHPLFNSTIDRETGFHTRNMLCCAICDMSGRNIAVLQALNKSGTSFTKSDEKNLKLFGTHLGNTLAKAKLHEKAKREKERLSALYTYFKSLATADDLEQVLATVTRSMHDVLHAEHAFVWVMDFPRKELWTSFKAGDCPDPYMARVRIGEGLVGTCASDKRVITISDYSGCDEPLISLLRPALGPDTVVKSVLVQPLTGSDGDKVVGVMLAINKREHDSQHDIFFEDYFTEADLEAMALFALEVGQTLNERSLECALASALSIVAHEPSGDVCGSADGGEEAGAPGVGEGTESELLLRSQLMNMYYQSAPEYKRVGSDCSSVNSPFVSRRWQRSMTKPGRTTNMGRADGTRSMLSNGGTRSADSIDSLPNGHGSGPEPAPGVRCLTRATTMDSAGPSRSQSSSGSQYAFEDHSGRVSSSGLSSSRRPVRAETMPSSRGTSASSLAIPALDEALFRPQILSDGQLPEMPAIPALTPRLSGNGAAAGAAVTTAAPRPPSGRSSMNGGSASPSPAAARRHSGHGDGTHAVRFSLMPLPPMSEHAPSGAEGELDTTPPTSPQATNHQQQGDGSLSGQASPQAAGARVYRSTRSPSGTAYSHSNHLGLAAAAALAHRSPHTSSDGTAGGGVRALLKLPSLSVLRGGVGQPVFFAAEQLLSWDMNFTHMQNDELVKLCYDMLMMSGVVEEFKLNVKTVRNFLSVVASHYHAIPYHNFNHVCHVLHGVWMTLQTTRAKDMLTMEDKLALLLAAICHDLDHDGYSNSYHINTQSELARIYNDISVMENHHCAMTFAILRRKDCALLDGFDNDARRRLRKTIVSAILCTDMSNHFVLTSEFKKHQMQYDRNNEADRLLLLKVLLHAADIGNAVRPFHINDVMSKRVHKEFQQQAAEEERLNLPITFSVDSSNPRMCAQIELNFLDYVVSPLWDMLAEVLPELAPVHEQLVSNRARYGELAAVKATTSAEGSAAHEQPCSGADGGTGSTEQPPQVAPSSPGDAAA